MRRPKIIKVTVKTWDHRGEGRILGTDSVESLVPENHKELICLGRHTASQNTFWIVTEIALFSFKRNRKYILHNLIRTGRLHFVPSLTWIHFLCYSLTSPSLSPPIITGSFWFNYVSSFEDEVTTYAGNLTFIDQEEKCWCSD